MVPFFESITEQFGIQNICKNMLAVTGESWILELPDAERYKGDSWTQVEI